MIRLGYVRTEPSPASIFSKPTSSSLSYALPAVHHAPKRATGLHQTSEMLGDTDRARSVDPQVDNPSFTPNSGDREPSVGVDEEQGSGEPDAASQQADRDAALEKFMVAGIIPTHEKLALTAWVRMAVAAAAVPAEDLGLFSESPTSWCALPRGSGSGC